MIHPYLVFHGRCNEALRFYQASFLCDEPQIMPYGAYIPEGVNKVPENLSSWVLHAEMNIYGTRCWFADEAQPVTSGNMLRLAVSIPTADECAKVFNAISQGGNITLPPTATFYSTFHGAVVDQFGVEWNITAEEAPGQ